MAPSPENDTAPKAPDKPRHEKPGAPKDDKGLSDLNDGELKGLLDEALNYKNPKDREGKSKLFNHLLNEAEEDERNARAARAGGSELVRYCNPSAKRNSRHRKKPSSISENMMHGGSLDNLAKEELFETSKYRTKKSVSARQREGGSLPCNVNANTVPNYQFLEEARRKKETEKKSYSNDLESESLLDHDCLAQDFQDQPPIEMTSYSLSQPTKYTSRATLQVNNVDDPIQLSHLEQPLERRTALEKNVFPATGYNVYLSNLNATKIIDDSKKVDENGNALQYALKAKKKKVLTDKNVVVCKAENVEGHRSDIINNVDKLLEFIGTPNEARSVKSKLNRNSSDDSSKSKKQRTHSSKNKDGRAKLKKSNSMGEISTTNLEEFGFDDEDNVVMRNSKNAEKPRERRSWGNMEPLPLQTLYNSAENLETAEFRVVTKRKKSKKRGNSMRTSSGKGKGNDGGQSPDMRRKSACSVPHSEKSNDSSDVDSVHSLPIDTQKARLNLPISYADMAKTNERPKERNKVLLLVEKVPKETEKVQPPSDVVKNTPPDVNNVKNFPAITKQVAVQVNVPIMDKTKTNSNKSKNTSKQGVKSNNSSSNNGGKTGEEQGNLLQDGFAGLGGGGGGGGSRDEDDVHYSCVLPPDIPDVQTIEKMQRMNQGHPTATATTTTNPPSTDFYDPHPQDDHHEDDDEDEDDCSADCDIDKRTNVDNRPPVVILSGLGKEVPGLVFGFDINEQLLSEDDNRNLCCEDFISRYVAPEVYSTTSHNHDKIVNFIGGAWEEAMATFSTTGKIQYYSDLL